LISPAIRFSHGTVKVGNKSQDFGLEIGNRAESAAFEHFASKNAEPKLNLVHPGSVLGGVVKDKAVGRVRQKSGAGLHRGQDTGLAFDAQVEVEIGFIGDKAYEGLGLVRVEIVDNEMPSPDAGVGLQRLYGYGPGNRLRCGSSQRTVGPLVQRLRRN
jgi:hypothetical protein